MTTPPTTLHERLAAELTRRTAVANAATPGPPSALCLGCAAEEYPCPEIRSLASRLGVSVDG